ncbi:MAG TPA: four helix bundle protein [Gemmatimonadales bacterium]|nr:four helix bundle protein [Gemmatimonadales bacterium]
MGDFSGLVVWRLSTEYVLAIYRATAGFPTQERFGLAAHLRKSAVSVASNIAEGSSKNGGPRDFANFMRIALGSLGEARTQTYLAAKLGYIDRPTATELSERARRIRAMLDALRLKAERRSPNPPPSTLPPPPPPPLTSSAPSSSPPGRARC